MHTRIHKGCTCPLAATSAPTTQARIHIACADLLLGVVWLLSCTGLQSGWGGLYLHLHLPMQLLLRGPHHLAQFLQRVYEIRRAHHAHQMPRAAVPQRRTSQPLVKERMERLADWKVQVYHDHFAGLWDELVGRVL